MSGDGKLPISVVVLTYNEERNIRDCLRSVCDWADEIFVVDSGSADHTLEIARTFTSNIVSHEFETYSRQRNWSQENLPLRNDWILHLDADERITPELAQSIQEAFRDGPPEDVEGFILRRRTVFMGRAILHGGCYPTHHLRLFRHQKGRCEDRLDNQHFLIDGPTRVLAGDMMDVLMSDLTTWLVRHARWAGLEAEQFEDRHPNGKQLAGRVIGNPLERRRWFKLWYGRAPLFIRAFAYFGFRYFFRLGFLDGMEGLIFHFLHGCFYRFYVDAKIYEARKQHKQSLNNVPASVQA